MNKVIAQMDKAKLIEHIQEQEKTIDSFINAIFKINNTTFERSLDIKFSKQLDLIILKGHMFQIQNVSPKKIILRVKGKAPEETPDGVFNAVSKKKK